MTNIQLKGHQGQKAYPITKAELVIMNGTSNLSQELNSIKSDTAEINEKTIAIEDSFIDNLFEELDDNNINPLEFYTKEESDMKFATKGELEELDIDTSHLAEKEHKHTVSDLLDFNPDLMDLKAAKVTIQDITNVFDANNVEDALLENKNSILVLQTQLGTQRERGIELANSILSKL